jgi:membrane-bound lytic murein transglycosylase B
MKCFKLAAFGLPMKHISFAFFHALFSALLVVLIAGLSADAMAKDKRQTTRKRAKPPAVKVETYAGRPQVEAFAEEMAGQGLNPAWIRQTLNQAQKLESVIRAVRPAPPGQRKNWQAYRDRFVEPARTEAGRQFMLEHAEALARASNQYGVPVDVILGILGVETYYGRHSGRYRVVDSLATLAFDYPAEEGKDRSAYFREQLAQFFVWCAKEQCQPLSVEGSYAGAMGLPQFMPENIHRYGRDFDGDGHIDLFNPVDAIGSVARFLALHGWVRQLDPVFQVDLEEAHLEPLMEPDILPTFTPAQLSGYGVQPLAPLPQGEKYAVVELQNGDAGSEYVLGSRNFYVLTRYNRSSYYAMAVLALGQSVVAEVRSAEVSNSPNAKINVTTGGSAAKCSQC